VSKQVLITGGAGFIGSHLADELLSHGYRVRALDCLNPQVHGEAGGRPHYLHPDVDLIIGDVRDRNLLRRALDGVDLLYHLAALVGVGQSMYEIERYTAGNNIATAALLEVLIERPVERLVVASSMSIYGEGLYRAPDGSLVPGEERSLDQLRRRDWEVRGPGGEALTPVPTPESKQPGLQSIYALSKFDQERMALIIGSTYSIPTVALRFFNVYGSRQALSNPYTGVMAIFGSCYLNGRAPVIFEDGLQQRDFVSVHDVARACRLAGEAERAPGRAINIGSGRPISILDLALRLAQILNVDLEPEIAGQYRAGDIRNCFSDITLAREVLGYEPAVDLDRGLEELAGWLLQQEAEDHGDKARAELRRRGLSG